MRNLIVLLLLAGCATAEQKERELRAQEDAYWRHVFAQCRAYGHAEGSEAFKTCAMQVDLANQQQSEAQRQMLMQEYMRGQGIFRRY